PGPARGALHRRAAGPGQAVHHAARGEGAAAPRAERRAGAEPPALPRGGDLAEAPGLRPRRRAELRAQVPAPLPSRGLPVTEPGAGGRLDAGDWSRPVVGVLGGL